MQHAGLAPRKTWLRALLTQCQLLNEALVQGATFSTPDDCAALIEKLPRPCSAIEEFVGRCVVAKSLLGERRLDAPSGRRDKALCRRVIEYCFGAPCRTESVAWPDAEALLDLVRLRSPGGASVHDPARLAADIRRVIIKKYRENLTDSSVACAVGVSRAETARVFRRIYGQSVRDFMADLRFAHAERLLRSTELKISAVAAEVGYRSPKDLYRLIKSRTGMTPARLREIARPCLVEHTNET